MDWYCLNKNWICSETNNKFHPCNWRWVSLFKFTALQAIPLRSSSHHHNVLFYDRARCFLLITFATIRIVPQQCGSHQIYIRHFLFKFQMLWPCRFLIPTYVYGRLLPFGQSGRSVENNSIPRHVSVACHADIPSRPMQSASPRHTGKFTLSVSARLTIL